jgi:outer membrane lipoprotein SlyB
MSETSETAKMNPLVGIAAVSVTVASLVGVGVMTGFIPTKSDKAPAASPVTATAPAAPTAPEPAKQAAAPEPQQKVAVAEPAPRPAPAPRPVQQQQPRPAPTVPAAAPAYPQGAAAPQYPATYDYPPTTVAQARAPAPAVCNNCGRVEAVNVQEVAGEGSGLGAVAGGVAGAVLGNQVGRGTGRKVATVAGAAGGAFAGHQAEKYLKSGKRYDVVVRMEDGSTRTFPYDNEPGFRAGERVRIVEGKLQYNN